ncbi:betA [Mytilus coruscus]|uniref:BetA n=1 Tax=Mytilus coruscus TaxID=42192 RepID=A0A6J8DYQ8_MYTCO|nr:betA [Mytilus coruscus]
MDSESTGVNEQGFPKVNNIMKNQNSVRKFRYFKHKKLPENKQNDFGYDADTEDCDIQESTIAKINQLISYDQHKPDICFSDDHSTVLKPGDRNSLDTTKYDIHYESDNENQSAKSQETDITTDNNKFFSHSANKSSTFSSDSGGTLSNSRFEIASNEATNFDRLKETVIDIGKLHNAWGIDYSIMRKSYPLQDYPDLVIGRPLVDTYLVSEAVNRPHNHAVDITKTSPTVYQVTLPVGSGSAGGIVATRLTEDPVSTPPRCRSDRGSGVCTPPRGRSDKGSGVCTPSRDRRICLKK